jgi:flagellar biogenesis protein FliO
MADPGNGKDKPQETTAIAGVSDVINTIKELSEVADKRASTFLLSVGTGLLILGVLGKTRLLSTLGTLEFVSLLGVCLACLISGAYIRMLQEKVANDHEFKMLEVSLRYSGMSQEETNKAILEAQNRTQKALEKLLERPKERLPGG